MKEVTYIDWVKNPVPRDMWVWDSNENAKKQRKVIYYSNQDVVFPVITLTSDDIEFESFKHCAEIEEVKTRLMTHRELARWLCEKPFREFKYGSGTHYPIYKYHTYTEDEASKEVCKDILIREDDGPWFIPYKESE